ncbi:class I SAM-dependent methyltransferase [Ornithinimicrobium ciconiae]|uniref:Class I SAM-dependent methyltransferase n=1 Tax=Ornithinimicrobium ciconiae TaxID=2594265 RepID=A0A516GG65_9MICO|nr:class I SAM-dependent methyltransferase [Ornithinimicrobium ciconiae]
MRTAYDTVAAAYQRSMPDTRPEDPLDLAMLDSFIASVSGQPVLDAGCGAGRISRYIADRGGRVEGVDLSPEMIAQGRAAHPDLDLSVASITDLPHGDASFGGVLLWYSTIHLAPADLTRALDESTRVLVPGGYLLVAFQSGVGTRDLFQSYSRHGHDVSLERYLRTPDQVAELLVARGLSEQTRLVRRGNAIDQDDQTMLLHRAGTV